MENDKTSTSDVKPEEETKETSSQVGETLDLEAINKTLGKDFKDLPTALESFKEAQAKIASQGEELKELKKADVKPDPTEVERLDNLESQLNESNFYRENTQYDNKETRELIEAIGGDPKEVIETDVFKNTFEKTSAYDKSQESKSVLHNSSRLKQVSTRMDDAKTAMDKADNAASSGNITEALSEKRKADADAVASVVDSMQK